MTASLEADSGSVALCKALIENSVLREIVHLPEIDSLDTFLGLLTTSLKVSPITTIEGLLLFHLRQGLPESTSEIRTSLLQNQGEDFSSKTQEASLLSAILFKQEAIIEYLATAETVLDKT